MQVFLENFEKFMEIVNFLPSQSSTIAFNRTLPVSSPIKQQNHFKNRCIKRDVFFHIDVIIIAVLLGQYFVTQRNLTFDEN